MFMPTYVLIWQGYVVKRTRAVGGNRRAFIKGAARAVGRRHHAETAVKSAEDPVKTRGKSF